MDAAGNPDMQDVRDGNALVEPSGNLAWTNPPPGANVIDITAPVDTVTVTARSPRDTSTIGLLLLAGALVWLVSEA